MSKTTFTVLMSVYHRDDAQYLNTALHSIWTEQTLRPDAIVLVEDGTLTDALEAVVKDWEAQLGDTIHVIRNTKNRGLAAALNDGLPCIKTDYMARMDADDRSAAHRFELEKAYLDAHPDVMVVGGAIQEFNEENDCLNVRCYPTEHIRQYVTKAVPLAHPATMMRMSLFREGNLRYPTDMPLNEDIALWFNIIHAGYSITNIPETIYYFRCSDGLYTRRSHEKAKAELRAYMRGIHLLYGPFTWRYIYPLLRYGFRKLPSQFIQYVYQSRMRRTFLQ